MSIAVRNVVIVQPIHRDAVELLKARNDMNVIIPASIKPEDVMVSLTGADGVILRTTLLTKAMIEQSPNLRIVSRHGVGLDNVALDVCRERSVTVTHTGDANSIPVAEHTFALILAVAKQLIPYDAAVRSGNYDIRNSLGMGEIFGKTILILGLGRIGRNVARIAGGFQMRCLGYDPALDANAIQAMGCTPLTDWRAALPEADVVTLHMPLTPEAANMIGASELDAMKQDAIVINCARGGLIDEEALSEALDKRAIFGAGLDVTRHEPPEPANPLLRNSRVILSPHSAALTEECGRRMAMRAAQNVLDCFDGRLNPVFVA